MKLTIPHHLGVALKEVAKATGSRVEEIAAECIRSELTASADIGFLDHFEPQGEQLAQRVKALIK